MTLRYPKNSKNEIFLAIGSCILIFQIVFFWRYKINELPGLHGDEAWAGLLAIHFLESNVDQLQGMNHYTGIFQVLFAELSFYLFEPSVSTLRLFTLLFNTLGLFIIVFSIRSLKKSSWSFLFLLIMAQSSLYITSGRIAWEVNTFTLLFFSLLFVSVIIILKGRDSKAGFFICVFLIVNILGSYNHIIFSSISFSLLVGLLAWSNLYRDERFGYLLSVLGVNSINIMLVFIVSKIGFNNLLDISPIIPISIAVGLIIIEIYIIKRYWFTIYTWYQHGLLPNNIIKFMLALGVISFVAFHGLAFLDLLSSYKVYLMIYSFEGPVILKILLTIGGLTYLIYLMKFLFEDLLDKSSSPGALIITSYLGIINLYTVQNSFRYYLILFLMTAIYLSYRMTKNLNKSITVIISLGISLIFTLLVHQMVLGPSERLVRTINLNVGNSQKESSGHYLSKKPLLDFFKNNHVSKIYYPTNSAFFIKTPVDFYRKIETWKEDTTIAAVVDFNRDLERTGYYIDISN